MRKKSPPFLRTGSLRCSADLWKDFCVWKSSPAEEDALALIEKHFIKSSGDSAAEIKKAIKDSWRRLLQPGMESEFRMALKTKADEEAIAVFAENLRQLLLSSPLGSKRILAIDPGYRTGCKVVCLDEQGSLQKTGFDLCS